MKRWRRVSEKIQCAGMQILNYHTRPGMRKLCYYGWPKAGNRNILEYIMVHYQRKEESA